MLLPLATRGQAQPLQIEGRVVDASTGASLPSTNISIGGTSRGTAANENGEFVLAVDSLPVRLTVSHIGYERVTQEVTEAAANAVEVQMEPTTIALGEAVATGRTAASYVQNALERVEHLSEARTRYIKGVKGFYRQKTGFYQETQEGQVTRADSDTVYTEYMEVFYNTFTSPSGIQGVSIDQARYAQSEGPNYRLKWEDFSVMTREWLQVPPSLPLEETYMVQPFHPDVETLFSFEIVGRLTQEGRDIVKIAYEPRSDLDTPAFAGMLFIDADTYDLYRYEGVVQSSGSFFWNVGGDMENTTLRVAAVFRRLDDLSATVLDQVRFDLSYEHAVAEYRRRYNTSSTFFVYDHNPTDTFGTSDIENDYAAIDEAEYDPAFWRNNPVLARTPTDESVIQSFEQTGAFGRLVEEPGNSE
ncbi:carboxypeptidase-like regulatory domain-containing protein [Longimonas halophila]|uniref:carboxypeptidase-like regulatory domain-containing protein n=1 Tax=Longimonas halophila TaxID=1469170 RepID=UPI001596E993|nr:carboxypeptidase-like regulatory domain-containing protein [Longimonas halophila]